MAGQCVKIMVNATATYGSVFMSVTSGSTTCDGSGPWIERYAFNSALARASATANVSVSARLRSRELWAAARFRLIRSIRRCSFSSSVLARFRGGRAVVGSGSDWPHDFLFFAGFECTMTEAGVAERK